MTSGERDDNYWMGVRDALRMVDSFLRWARKHPKDAKSIDDFLAEGLIAAAKRCESCLGKELGMKYGSDDPEVDEPREIEEPSHFEEPIPDIEPEVEVASEVLEEDVSFDIDDVAEPVSVDVVTEPEITPAEPVSIDEIETSTTAEESMSAEDLAFEGIKRDFLSDFPLDETMLIAEDDGDAQPSPTTPEDVMRAVLEEASLFPPEEESEEVASSDEVAEIYDDVIEVIESSPEPGESPSVAAPRRDLWSPYDEPPLQDEEEEGVISMEEESSDESEVPSTVKPPPPPPPPETDETEEERRRRARRLFFGT